MVSSAICLISLEPAGETSSRVREQFELRAVRLRAPIFISEFKKYRLQAYPNQLYLFAVPSHLRGVSRSSRARGGMRWTRIMLLTRAFDADGKVVWS